MVTAITEISLRVDNVMQGHTGLDTSISAAMTPHLAISLSEVSKERVQKWKAMAVS